MSDAPPPKPDRNLAIDAVKGIGILQVVVHHALGQGARLYSTKGSGAWTAMRAVAWSTNFAIPLFLLLSAMLLAGSLARSPNAEPFVWERDSRPFRPYLASVLACWGDRLRGIGRFVWRRASRTLWPYLVWTLVYWADRSRSNSGLWRDLDRLGFEVLHGKAFYHLYFMVILLQLSLAMPFVVALLRRVSIGFGTILFVSLALQYGAFVAQKEFIRSQTPATMLYWYVPSLLIGAWIGLNRDRWTDSWRSWWPALTLVGVAAACLFTVMNLDGELGRPWNGLAFNGTSVLFRVSASLALLGAAPALANLRVGPFLAGLGRYSLPIYLVHPEFLKLLGGPRVSHAFGLLPVPVFWTVLMVTAASCVFAWVASLAKLDLLLFGQSLPRAASKGSGGQTPVPG